VDEHSICAIEKDVAVLQERGVATAMALVLAEKLAAADKKFLLSVMLGVVGWVVAGLLAILMTILKSKL
jgi:hypothetical protein